MKLIKDNNLLINNKTDIMIEIKGDKYRLNVQALDMDSFDEESGLAVFSRHIKR